MSAGKGGHNNQGGTPIGETVARPGNRKKKSLPAEQENRAEPPPDQGQPRRYGDSPAKTLTSHDDSKETSQPLRPGQRLRCLKKKRGTAITINPKSTGPSQSR